MPETQGAVVECGVAGMALDVSGTGDESGDAHVVARFQRGALVAVIDGLGHGAEAAVAARMAARVLHQHAREPIVDLVRRCHEALRATRGAVMTLASFNTVSSSLSWTGVGNVEGVLVRPNQSWRREGVASRGGVVGYQLPPLRATELPISAGDILIMATDGVRSGFANGLIRTHSPQQMADSILARYRRGSDDALVVVARYAGDSL